MATHVPLKQCKYQNKVVKLYGTQNGHDNAAIITLGTCVQRVQPAKRSHAAKYSAAMA
jgi:hypothetical protein